MISVPTALGPFVAFEEDDLTKYFQAHAPHGFWDQHLCAAFDATRADGIAIDVGANIGFQTVYLAERFPRVLAIEAHPITALVLQENVRVRGLLDDGSVCVVGTAAYDRPGISLELASTAIHGWPEAERSLIDLDTVPHVGGFTFVEDPSQHHHLHEVRIQTMRIDDLLFPEIPVRLMKIDVQGAALRVLKGSLHTITKFRPRIVFEYEPHVSQCRGDDWPDYLKFFDEHRYTLEAIPGPWQDFLAVPQ